MEKRIETAKLVTSIKLMKPIQMEAFQGMQRPIKMSCSTRPTDIEESKGEASAWIDGLIAKVNNTNFTQVVAILKNDPELEPLLEDHQELLETLSEIQVLTAKQMLAIISAAEKEYYEAKQHKTESAPSEEDQSQALLIAELQTANKDLNLKLEEKMQIIRTLEVKTQECDNLKQIETEYHSLRTSYQILLEENKDINSLLKTQSKLIMEVEQLQKELLNAKSEVLSTARTKKEIEEKCEKNNELIENLQKEILLLQSEKQNLTRQLNSTLKANQLASVKLSPTPIKIPENNKYIFPYSSERLLVRSQSFDSSIKYNGELAKLFINFREHSETQCNLIEIQRVEEDDLRIERSGVDVSRNTRTAEKDSQREFTLIREDEPDVLSSISPPSFIPEESKISEVQERREELIDNLKLVSSIQDLKNENEFLKRKLSEAKKKFHEMLEHQTRLFSSELSKVVLSQSSPRIKTPKASLGNTSLTEKAQS